jgi:hypothetical protein
MEPESSGRKSQIRSPSFIIDRLTNILYAVAQFNIMHPFVCTDPFHVNCQRIISVDGTKASLKGTDGNPGCPADGSGMTWTLTGKVDGKNIFVDFTPKGGPKDLKGVFDGTGINWPDGKYYTHTHGAICGAPSSFSPLGCCFSIPHLLLLSSAGAAITG